MPDDPKDDILVHLWNRAAKTNDPDERHMLMRAAETIETLREMVGIRDEVELEFAEPQGRA